MPTAPPGAGGEPEAPFDREIERFDRFCSALVRIEPMSLPELQGSVLGFIDLVELHLRDLPPADAAIAAGRGASSGRDGALDREHQRFRVSVAELRGLLAVVEHDDHGGHRQALGQYGRILAEALRAHRREERAPGARGGPPAAAGNHN